MARLKTEDVIGSPRCWQVSHSKFDFEDHCIQPKRTQESGSILALKPSACEVVHFARADFALLLALFLHKISVTEMKCLNKLNEEENRKISECDLHNVKSLKDHSHHEKKKSKLFFEVCPFSWEEEESLWKPSQD